MARDYSALKQHVKVHTFRITTAVAAWALIALAFYYRPDLIKWGLRASTGGIEMIGDSLPYPWGDRIEIALRELGGSFWLQITVVIVLLRFVLSTIAMGWRTRRRRLAARSEREI
jgi:hypothetical protein